MIPRNELVPAGALFKVVVAAAGVLLSAYLLWKLRGLIVPVAVGGLMAYICRPLIGHLEHYRIHEVWRWGCSWLFSCLPCFLSRAG